MTALQLRRRGCGGDCNGWVPKFFVICLLLDVQAPASTCKPKEFPNQACHAFFTLVQTVSAANLQRPPLPPFLRTVRAQGKGTSCFACEYWPHSCSICVTGTSLPTPSTSAEGADRHKQCQSCTHEPCRPAVAHSDRCIHPSSPSSARGAFFSFSSWWLAARHLAPKQWVSDYDTRFVLFRKFPGIGSIGRLSHAGCLRPPRCPVSSFIALAGVFAVGRGLGHCRSGSRIHGLHLIIDKSRVLQPTSNYVKVGHRRYLYDEGN